MRKNLHINPFGLFALFVLSFFGSFLSAQTTLINPSAGGGFELGSTFASNGWTVSNSVNNPWTIGTVVTNAPIGGNSAYISTDGGATTGYVNTTPCVNYFYRDVTVPSGESKITLTFNWQQQGENSYDIWQVFVSPTSITPVGQNTSAGFGTNNVPASIAGATYVGNGAVIAGVQTATLYLPASLAGTTFRLIFAWKNDGGGGTQPPAAIDNISLTSQVPGTFISVTTGNWTTPSTWDANAVPSPVDNAIVSTSDVVTIDAINLGIANLSINGTLQFGATPTQFNVNSNLTVSSTGVFNVFNAATGKSLFVSGNVTNNGSIDISVGTTTAGVLNLNGSLVQTIGGTGTFGTPNMIRNLICSNTNASIPNIVWNINNVKIANNLNLTGAKINLGTNKLTFGYNAAPVTLTVPVGCGFLPGAKFSRYWNATATGSAITAGTLPGTTTSRYPFINAQGQNRSIWITRTNATGAVAGEMAVTYTDGVGVTSNLSVVDGAYTVNDRYNGNWNVTDEGTPIFANTYTLAINAESAYTALNANSRIMHLTTPLTGAHQNGSILPMGQRNTVTHADLLAGPLYLGIASVDVVPSTPGAITQSAGLPTCSAGTDLTASGTPGTDVTWYWQTGATETSMTTAYTGPYTVFANGTYYLRAYNSVNLQWSTASSSYTISNFPLAANPPAPTALVNPACAPGTTISVPAPIAGYEYYWQGTNAGGTSNALSTSSVYSVTTTGTYYVAAYEIATQCWSSTTSVSVVVDNLIPFDPTVTIPVVNICNGATSALIEASALTQTTGSLTAATASGNGCTGGAMIDVAAQAMPITINTVDIKSTTASGTLNVYYKVGTYLGSETNAAAWTLLGTTTFSGTAQTMVNVDITDLTIPANTTYGIYFNYAAAYTTITVPNTYSNADVSLTVGAGLCSAFGGVNANRAFNGAINYTAGFNADVAWFTSATGGTQLGVGTPFEAYGTTVLPNSLTNGSYEFYAAGKAGGCYSVNRSLVTVNVTPVLVSLNPMNASCNGNNNGSFSVATVLCGTSPFLYSLNGGALGPIPTNLVAGTYSVVVQDAGGLLSAPISLVVGQPAPPANLTLVDANYYTADVSWTTSGNETQWNVEYGPVGFTPGTGTVILANTTSATLTNLQANTAYSFYVTAVCGTGAVAAGPSNFSTNAGFFTFDNACGPGFNDISTSGVGHVVGDDGQFDFTLPFNWSYQGLTITTLSVDNNGGISFVSGAGVPLTNGTIAAAANGLYPFWDDLDIVNIGDESVFTEIIGAAPNRQAIIQWNTIHNNSGGTEFVFQVVIDEATNEVYYIYDNVVLGNALYDYGTSATIGAAGPLADVQVSFNNATYLQNNSCVHFYNALCPNPINVTNSILQEEVTLDWDAGLYGETDWTLIYGPAGFDPATSGTTITVSTSDANIFGLQQLTNYDVYIYSECTIDNLTSGGLLVSFQTLPWCANPNALGGTTAVDSLFSTWNFVSEVGTPVQALSGFNLQYGVFGFDLYSGTVQAATGINYADTVANPAFLAGGVYQVYVQAVCGTDTSNYAGPYTFVMPLSNDSVCGAEMLMANGTIYTFNNAGATVQLGEAAIAPPVTGAQTTTGWINSTLNNTVWFTFVAPASGNIRVNNTAINYAGQSAVYSSIGCSDFNNFTLIAANDNAIGGTSVAANYTICGLTPGATYYLLHDGNTATTGNYSISILPIDLNAGAFANVINVCTGDTVNLFDGITGNDNGGVWTAQLASAGTGVYDSLFVSSGLAYQVFNFEYRITDGCAYDSIIGQVKIYPSSSAGTDGTISVCRNQPYDLLSGLGGNVDLGGTWYNPSNAAIPSSSIVSSNFPGQYNYDYITGNGVCPDDTANVLVTVLSTCDHLDIQEMYFGEMSLLPNPTNGLVYITNTGSSEVFNYEITDIDGRIIATKTAAINGTSVTAIDLNGKVTGMYMIRVYNDNAEKVFRVILQ